MQPKFNIEGHRKLIYVYRNCYSGNSIEARISVFTEIIEKCPNVTNKCIDFYLGLYSNLRMLAQYVLNVSYQSEHQKKGSISISFFLNIFLFRIYYYVL